MTRLFLILDGGLCQNIWLMEEVKWLSVFLQYEMIDVFRLTVIPVLIGDGKRLFTGDGRRKNLDCNMFLGVLPQLLHKEL